MAGLSRSLIVTAVVVGGITGGSFAFALAGPDEHGTAVQEKPKTAAKASSKPTTKPTSTTPSTTPNTTTITPTSKAAEHTDAEPVKDAAATKARSSTAPTKSAEEPASHSSATSGAKEHGSAGSTKSEATATKTATASDAGSPKTADEALAALASGNERWVAGNSENPNIDSSRRLEQATNGQTPFAAVLTCADSRLPVERIFDRGVGEVFVARVAGNVVSPHQTGSIEYAAEHLNVPLLVVMGHTKCGAVKAAVSGGHLTPNIDSIVKSIKPAVDRARVQAENAGDDALLAASIRENVWGSVFELISTSPTVRTMVEQKKLKVVGAVCDVQTGKVTFLGEHPWQNQLVTAFKGAATTEKTAAADEGH